MTSYSSPQNISLDVTRRKGNKTSLVVLQRAAMREGVRLDKFHPFADYFTTEIIVVNSCL